VGPRGVVAAQGEGEGQAQERSAEVQGVAIGGERLARRALPGELTGAGQAASRQLPPQAGR